MHISIGNIEKLQSTIRLLIDGRIAKKTKDERREPPTVERSGRATIKGRNRSMGNRSKNVVPFIRLGLYVLQVHLLVGAVLLGVTIASAVGPGHRKRRHIVHGLHLDGGNLHFTADHAKRGGIRLNKTTEKYTRSLLYFFRFVAARYHIIAKRRIDDCDEVGIGWFPALREHVRAGSFFGDDDGGF